MLFRSISDAIDTANNMLNQANKNIYRKTKPSLVNPNKYKKTKKNSNFVKFEEKLKQEQIVNNIKKSVKIVNNTHPEQNTHTVNEQSAQPEHNEQHLNSIHKVTNPSVAKFLDKNKYPNIYNPIRTASLTKAKFNVYTTSVRGNSHISSDSPCQDYSAYKQLSNNWGIAVTADGAGSAKLSHLGSKMNCKYAIELFEQFINKAQWNTNLYTPTQLEWNNEIPYIFDKIYKKALNFAKCHNIEVTALSATINIVVHTHFGLLTAHIGDGRAEIGRASSRERVLRLG